MRRPPRGPQFPLCGLGGRTCAAGERGRLARRTKWSRSRGSRGRGAGPEEREGRGPGAPGTALTNPPGPRRPASTETGGFPGPANPATSVPLDSLTYQGPQPPPQPRARRARPPRQPPQDHAPPVAGQSLSGPHGDPTPSFDSIQSGSTGRGSRALVLHARARAFPAVQLAAGDAQGVMRAPRGCVRSPATL